METGPKAEARVPTALPGRYLTQLCKHFEHKLPVSHGAGRGRIEFPTGICTLDAVDAVLVLQVTAADAEGLARLEDVVARHLVRFAFREAMEVQWVRAG